MMKIKLRFIYFTKKKKKTLTKIMFLKKENVSIRKQNKHIKIILKGIIEAKI